MSRSYRRTPGACDRNPFMKNKANRRIRHTADVPSGRSYRKFSQTYDICDFRFLCHVPDDIKYWDKPYKAITK